MGSVASIANEVALLSMRLLFLRLLLGCESANVGEATRFRLEKRSIVSCRFLGSTALVAAEPAAYTP